VSATQSRSGATSSGFFRKEREAELLAQAVGDPSGVLVTIGGYEFNLVPFDTDTGIKLFALIPRIGLLWGKMQAGVANDSDASSVEDVIENDAPWILGLIKATLLDSASCADPDLDVESFEKWFGRTRFIPMLEVLVPKILRANGMDSLADQIENAIARYKNKPDPTTPAETPEPELPLTEGIVKT